MRHVMICEKTVMGVAKTVELLNLIDDINYPATGEKWEEMPDYFECSDTFYAYFVEHCHEAGWRKGAEPLWEFDGDLVVLKPEISRVGLRPHSEIVVRNPNLKWKTPVVFETAEQIIDHFDLPRELKQDTYLHLDTALNGYVLSIFIPQSDWEKHPELFEPSEKEKLDFHMNSD
jgi:hypothetical protein